MKLSKVLAAGAGMRKSGHGEAGVPGAQAAVEFDLVSRGIPPYKKIRASDDADAAQNCQCFLQGRHIRVPNLEALNLVALETESEEFTADCTGRTK